MIREKPIRTPKTILQSNRKSFEKILGSVKEHIRKEKAKLDQEEFQKKAQQKKKIPKNRLTIDTTFMNPNFGKEKKSNQAPSISIPVVLSNCPISLLSTLSPLPIL